uniref:Par3/HAL N-terminal domain-containing protein n=1 Tax=Sciurus vulgaris TaxID=55149 RepID=A0A8D2DC25_SCIVU
MKVTVCFGRTGIVVPCKEGQLRVRELTQQALQWYLKTQEKDPENVSPQPFSRLYYRKDDSMNSTQRNHLSNRLFHLEHPFNHPGKAL